MRDFEILREDPPVAVDGGERYGLTVRVPADLRYLEGHFEGNPIVPGVAQLLPLVLEPASRVWPDLGALRTLRRLKFKAALRPGDTLEVQLTRQAEKVRFELRRDGELCTRGALTFG